MVTNWWISCVRTIVAPLLVGVLAQGMITSVEPVEVFWRISVTVAVALIFYVFARFLQGVSRFFGVLLLCSAEPYYFEEDEEQRYDPAMIAVQRTAVPLVVGWALTIVACWAVSLDGVQAVVLLCSLTAVLYGSLRWVEERSVAGTRIREIVGILLGAPLAPHY